MFFRPFISHSVNPSSSVCIKSNDINEPMYLFQFAVTIYVHVTLNIQGNGVT